MPALVVTPKIPRKNAPGILWIHGGGYMTARDTGEVNIAYQMPLYPMLDIFENIYNGKVNRELVRRVAQLMDKDDRVLECACGTGMISKAIAIITKDSEKVKRDTTVPF